MGYSHNAKYKQSCATKADVIAAFGQNLPRQIKGSERASFWGNPLAGGATKSITVAGLGADFKGTRKLRLHAKIAEKAAQAFQKIQQVNKDYVLYSVGSLCVRYMKNSGTRNSIRDGADYAAARQQYGDKWARGWPMLALQYDNQRNKVQWTKVSNHSFGTAIDFNPATNPYKAGKPFDMPKWLVLILREHGFGWGGYYHDYMHFEYEQKDVSSTAATTTPAAPSGGGQPADAPSTTPAAGAAGGQPSSAPAAGGESHCTKCGVGMRPGSETTPGASTVPTSGAAGKSNCTNPIPYPADGYGQAAAVDNKVEGQDATFYFFKDDYGQPGCPNRTVIGVPKGYVPQDHVDLWTHFHGLNKSNTSLEKYVTKHKFEQILKDSGKNVIWATSRGGADARVGRNCKPGGYADWIKRICAFLCAHGPYQGKQPGIGGIIASGHSAGGYVGITKLMEIGDMKSQIKEYVIHDGLYVGASTVIKFVKENPAIMVRSLGTTHNPPHSNSEKVTRAVGDAKNWYHSGRVQGITHANVVYRMHPDVLKNSFLVPLGAPGGSAGGGSAGAADAGANAGGGADPSFPAADPSKLPTPHCGKPPHVPQGRPKGRPQGWEEYWTCGPTSCQMAIKYFKPNFHGSLSEFDLMMKLCELGGVTKKGSSLGKNRKICESAGLKTEHSSKGDKSKTVPWIQQKLQAGALVVLSGNLRTRPWKPSEGGSRGHFMLITGMNEKGEFVIHDPGGVRGKGKIMNSEQLYTYIFSGSDRSGRQLAILQPG